MAHNDDGQYNPRDPLPPKGPVVNAGTGLQGGGRADRNVTLEADLSYLDSRYQASAASTVTSFFPQLMRGSNQVVFATMFQAAVTVDSLTIYAYTAPTQSGGFPFDVRRNSATQNSVTLGQGVTEDTYALDISISSGDRLDIVPGQSGPADSLAEVIFSFSIS